MDIWDKFARLKQMEDLARSQQAVPLGYVPQYHAAPVYPSQAGNTYPSQAGTAMHTHQITSPHGAHIHNILSPEEVWKNQKRTLLYMRLELREGEKAPFEFLDFTKGNDCIYVIVAAGKGSRPVVLEDDIGLFPSDTLVTQLRLMVG